ncbi:NADPH-dependent FMN reductase [Alicyclobacillus shizuokensis]|uniref:NADPH-dependent FMN reductase n=1 Tax=Alicyclobacillus shizuokensis TaxID=392014 RepID=UPI00082B6A38|nr:NADPH-dependent FMN reductase [Alicyclobacillus shizuokensis]
MTRIALVSGSPSEPFRLATTLEWLSEHFETHGIDTQIILVRDLPPEDLLHARTQSATISRVNQIILDADAVVIGTPIYKASYTGVLKAYLDLLPTGALENKPVLPVAVGGTIAHLLALEYALKPVLSVLGATTLEKSVFGLDTQFIRNESSGGYDIAPDLQERLSEAVQALIKRFDPVALRLS